MPVTPPADPTAAPTWPTPPERCPVCDAARWTEANHPWGQFVTYDCGFKLGSFPDEPAWEVTYPCWNIAAQLAWRKRAESAERQVKNLSEVLASMTISDPVSVLAAAGAAAAWTDSTSGGFELNNKRGEG